MASNECQQFEEQLHREVTTNILPFWAQHSVDNKNGGFIGRLSNDLIPDYAAPKGLILNARILWSFSAAYRFTPSQTYQSLADRAFNYILEHFIDREYGGAFWLLDSQGYPVDEKKKVYGQAFVIYALAEYYAAFSRKQALDEAIDIFHRVEEHCYDDVYQGYFEASHRDWSLADDLRLSEIDMNEKKSMNAHLHILEAYTNLHRIWPDEHLGEQLHELLSDFLRHILNPGTYHFTLFFNEQWEPRSENISYGHEIEGSWLLNEAAEEVGDENLQDRIREVALGLAESVKTEGLNEKGGVNYEWQSDQTVDEDRHWWPQAEALVGFLNAFRLSEDERYYQAAREIWNFIHRNLIDHERGGWYYKVSGSGEVDPEILKISEWKGPYHNTRACLEGIRQLQEIREAGMVKS